MLPDKCSMLRKRAGEESVGELVQVRKLCLLRKIADDF